MPQNAYKENTHTLAGTDTQAQRNIKQRHTELQHKHTSNKIGLRPHRGKYGVQKTLCTRPLLTMMLHAGTKTNTTHRTSKISYRPMSTFTFSQEKYKNER